MILKELLDQPHVTLRVRVVSTDVLDPRQGQGQARGAGRRSELKAWLTGTIESDSPWIRRRGRFPHARAAGSVQGRRSGRHKIHRAAGRIPGLNQLGSMLCLLSWLFEEPRQIAIWTVDHSDLDSGVAGPPPEASVEAPIE